VCRRCALWHCQGHLRALIRDAQAPSQSQQSDEFGIVKAPIIVNKEDDPKQPAEDPDGVTKENVGEKYGYWLRAAVGRWKEHHKVYKQLGKRPVLFIMAEKNIYADGIAEYLWVSNGEHQPVCSRVQDEAHLIGERAAATRAVGSELGLVQFDQVFGLTPGAVERLVDMLGRSGLDAGHDEADVEAPWW
jgi:hypothetical protein